MPSEIVVDPCLSAFLFLEALKSPSPPRSESPADFALDLDFFNGGVGFDSSGLSSNISAARFLEDLRRPSGACGLGLDSCLAGIGVDFSSFAFLVCFGSCSLPTYS